ncbi:hypothetical protein M9Y10_034776 [Tritrichomonas musculus]|uniref:Uncharacterized protein n=1 Tax=Tritrichomonas musculus TaxID=1915356 RepID=A0ABR2KFZ9_9EUKA
MQSTIPKATNKDKQKNKPKIGAGSKDEKRKQKKEKLAEVLQMKKEAQQAAQKTPEEPVTFGKDFEMNLLQISVTDVSDMVRKPSKRQKAMNAVSNLKQIFANSNFSNSTAIFGEVNSLLNQKSANLQAQNALEEQKRIEKEMIEKQLNQQ